MDINAEISAVRAERKRKVLHRSKFHFKEETIRLVINAVKQYGVEVIVTPAEMMEIIEN